MIPLSVFILTKNIPGERVVTFITSSSKLLLLEEKEVTVVLNTFSPSISHISMSSILNFEFSILNSSMAGFGKSVIDEPSI